MAYKPLNSTEAISDLISRKEFYQLKKGEERDRDEINQPEIDQLILRNKFLPKSHQILIGVMISPDTPYMRIHCSMQTGVGKTQAALQPAWKFIATYKKIYQILSAKVSTGRAGVIELDRNTPSVFILGFGGTRTAFLRDLIMTPDYGFCNTEEREELNRRRAASTQSPEQFKAYKDYYSFIKKRVTNKSRGGFFKFYGYDEFMLRLFKTDIPLTQIEDEIMARRDEATPEEIFDSYIDAGKIIVNESLLAMFNGSLMICDEIHNTYNMHMKNNRGLAIQYVLDHVPNVRFISLSATALNNSPTEIVEIINYLVPKSERVTKRDLFLNSRDLKPGALDKIGDLLRDKISFVQDANIKYYPERVFLGNEIKLPHAVESLPAGSLVPYLKFIECDMSDYHWDACIWLEQNYEKILKQSREEKTLILDSIMPESTAVISTDAPDTIDETIDGINNDALSDSTSELAEEDYEDVIERTTIRDDKSPRVIELSQPISEQISQQLSRSLSEQISQQISQPDGDRLGGDDMSSRLGSAGEKKQSREEQSREEQSREKKQSRGEKPSRDMRTEGTEKSTQPDITIPREDVIVDENTKVPTDSYAIYDMVYPSVDRGIFRSSDIRSLVSYDLPTRDRLKITIKKMFGTNVISGAWMELESLKKYSSKYARLITMLHEDLRSAAGDQSRGKKIFIFHERVQSSGVLAIEQILLRNGFIDEASEPSDNTLCSFCGRRFDEHPENIAAQPAGIEPHQFNPSRFFMMHSMIKKSIMDQNRERYNSPENRNGKNLQIVLGSRIIRESYEFKAVQKAYILSLPTNISTLLQVLGRFNRNMSHIDLPPEQRRVEICILLSTIGPRLTTTISLELYRYIYKLLDYRIIQEIDRKINRSAFDADIHRGINMSADIRRLYFDTMGSAGLSSGSAEDNRAKEILGNLYFEPAIEARANGSLDTFRAYKYTEDEIRSVVYVIKRLFLVRDAYTYDELLRAVRRNPFMTEINPNLISEDSFIIALNHLVSSVGEMISDANVSFVERLFDYNSKYIWDLHGGKNKIEQIGPYYIMFPVITIPETPLEKTYVHTIEYVRDRERAIIKKFVAENNKIDVDVRTYIQPRLTRRPVNINVNDYIKRRFEATNYEILRAEFLESPPQDINWLIWNYTDKFQMGILADSIEHIIGESAKGAAGGDERVIDTIDSINTIDTINNSGTSLPEANLSGGASASSTSGFPSDIARDIVKIFTKFDAVIYVREVKKYKDVLKSFRSELTLSDNIPIGFACPTGCKLYDPDEKTWFEVSKLSMNRHTTYKENEIIIGQFETVDGQQRFKLRRPIQVIARNLRAMPQSEEGTIDTRLLERGIVCETKSKQELLSICASLGISLQKHKEDLRIRTLCSLVRDNLILSEQRARARRDKYAYIYSWWSEIPKMMG